MKLDRVFPRATVSRKAEASLRAGHVWVYDTEVKAIDGACESGALIDVMSEKGTYLGTGFYSAKSKLRLRVISTNANETFGDAFFRRRVAYAIDYRAAVMGDDFGCCRLIFGESDGLPGLTVDRYGDIIVSEVLSVGTELRRDMIYRALCDRLAETGTKVAGIYERCESQVRTLEGLPQHKGWYECDFCGIPSPLTEITENGVTYGVDVENGQKTGFFLDQKYNRAAVGRLAHGRRVLDCFTHTGSFALNAAKGGAERVLAIDVSDAAVQLAHKNAQRNGVSDVMSVARADVFDLLPQLCAERADFDFVILDPPAFTKNRATIKDAERGYHEINSRAMKLLPRGGFLATCSCSHFMSADNFKRILRSAAADANVTLKLIEARGAAPDHPVLMSVPETDYLKFYLFQIV